MILTIDEAAEELGIGVAGVWKMVSRRQIEPIKRGAKPLRFWLDDVAEARVRRLSAAEVARLDTLAARLFAPDAESVSG